MRMAKYICRFQLLALAMLLVLVVLISAPSSANADKVMVNKDKEFDEAYWQEFLSTPFTDTQSPTGIKEKEHQRELAYTYGYDYPGEICDHSGFLQVDHVGVEKCIGRDQGLCKDGWEFGIYRKGGSYFVQLRKESDRNNPVYKRYGVPRSFALESDLAMLPTCRSNLITGRSIFLVRTSVHRSIGSHVSRFDRRRASAEVTIRMAGECLENATMK